MGSGNSRHGSGHSRTGVNRRSKLLSSLLCGCSNSRAAPIEEYSNVYPVSSAENFPPFTDLVRNLPGGSLISSTGTQFCSPSTETGASSGSSIAASGYASDENGRRNVETSNHGKCLAHSKELICPHLVSANSSPHESYRDRNSTTASTSFKEQETSDSVSVNHSANKNAVNGIDNSEKGVSQICPGPSSSSSQTLGDSRSDGVSAENHASEITTAHNSSVSHVPDLPVTFHSLADESVRGAMPAGLGFLVSNREQSRPDGSVLHVDVVSISSSVLSSGSADSSNREVRRNSRRLFWDAFSRRSSRRLTDSPTIVFSANDADDLGSHDRWLLDLSGDFFDDGTRGDSGYMGSRIHSLNERRRHSRSEIWERLRSGLDENRQTNFCPSGMHPDGSCSCESFMMSDESNSRTISRIVMLAEALFEVLDEIHRQPVSLSLSMVSLPAPESVVDSLPLKNHKKVDKAGCGGDDVEQCYICLAEYEEGDKIRVLPCHHEYHMSCVDKWLKEIHGVCPLCRGDVRQVAIESSNTETPNI
ncbi:E3 ubiquitin-protein ligase RLIM-like [Mangifera indica]|uniref:E3 ubiquitin-protein ligase RLIM-like n=1 Tax=Mangifera indica TaxID=29780 RepID=UPI001CFA5B59|nr:E3 ubiquitin-protein ligase RLIM-like [Mangifera indica]XP_044464492.1 E3 ubiquitin-protein ligase RLIM-like [Mangifera indica]